MTYNVDIMLFYCYLCQGVSNWHFFEKQKKDYCSLISPNNMLSLLYRTILFFYQFKCFLLCNVDRTLATVLRTLPFSWQSVQKLELDWRCSFLFANSPHRSGTQILLLTLTNVLFIKRDFDISDPAVIDWLSSQLIMALLSYPSEIWVWNHEHICSGNGVWQSEMPDSSLSRQTIITVFLKHVTVPWKNCQFSLLGSK